MDMSTNPESRQPPSADKAPANGAESPRALSRFLEIVDLIAEAPGGLTLAQLSSRIGSPKSSLLAILRPLGESGHLVRVDDRYQFGTAMFRLASRIQSVRPFSPLIRPIMQRLADSSGESVYFAVLDRDMQCVRYTEGIESHQVVRYAASVGADRPLYCGAGALALLAHQPTEWSDAFLRRVKLTPLTAATLTDPDKILARLEEIRQRGVSISVCEAAPSAAGIAAPVFDSTGAVFGALLIAAPIDRFLQQRVSLESLVKQHAKEASGI